jgi:putative colanic acid biosynthesis acetyltransferase WcaF
VPEKPIRTQYFFMKKTDLSTYNNSWYQPGNPIKRLFWFGCNHLFVNTYFLHIKSIKIGLLRLFGARIGIKVNIKPGVNIKYPWLLEIGDYAWIGEGVWIDNLAKVSIGAHACISQGALLLCGNHNYSKSSFDLMVKEISLEEGVWIGAKAMVCPGVTCHSHAVLSAGSIATKNLDAYSIYAGNPAQKIRDREINNP